MLVGWKHPFLRWARVYQARLGLPWPGYNCDQLRSTQQKVLDVLSNLNQMKVSLPFLSVLREGWQGTILPRIAFEISISSSSRRSPAWRRIAEGLMYGRLWSESVESAFLNWFHGRRCRATLLRQKKHLTFYHHEKAKFLKVGIPKIKESKFLATPTVSLTFILRFGGFWHWAARVWSYRNTHDDAWSFKDEKISSRRASTNRTKFDLLRARNLYKIKGYVLRFFFSGRV